MIGSCKIYQWADVKDKLAIFGMIGSMSSTAANETNNQSTAMSKPIVSPTGKSSTITRRHFLGTAATALTAAAAFPTIIPSSALGKDGAVAPSNRITVGVIGCGPQGRGDMQNFLNQDICQVVAVCDVKTDQLEFAKQAVNERYQNSSCQTYRDFREVVARKDIDACLIATPDHWHVLASLAAVNSGKDIYTEKPLGVTLEEGQALRAAVHRKKRVFQFGTQQRSSRNFRFAAELARNERIGKLKHINVWAPGSAPGGSLVETPPPAGLDYDLWLGPAEFRPHTENRCTDDSNLKTWWFDSQYALGFIAGWGIHPIDIALWGGGELLGGRVVVEGRGNFRSTEGVCDTATIWEVDYTFASGVTMKFVGVPNGGNQGKPTGEPFLHGDEWKARYHLDPKNWATAHGTAFEGSDGWVHVDRSSINFQQEELNHLSEDSFKTKLIQSKNQARNFLDCVQSRAETISPIDVAVRGDALCHIADIAIRLGRKLTFDFKDERFVHDDEANQRLKVRPMRKPWHL
jgi:predicted dehydrogenase